MSVVIPEPSVAGIVTATLDESIDISIDVPPDTESMEYVRGMPSLTSIRRELPAFNVSVMVFLSQTWCWCLYYCCDSDCRIYPDRSQHIRCDKRAGFIVIVKCIHCSFLRIKVIPKHEACRYRYDDHECKR